MATTVGRTLRDAAGRSLRLGGRLGGGGEGDVFEVEGRADLAAKIYHRPASPEKAAKLVAMAAARTDRLLALAAWPIGTLHDPGGATLGFLMPRGRNHKDIHLLYGPKSRRNEFPDADWRFLLRTAANLARAFATIHAVGCVISDINHGNFLVSPRGTVMPIDCDSYQFRSGERVFRCEVGTSLFTPPELQGRPFREVVRTVDHDAFGLAVLIFHLLFMGRHPYAGRFHGPGEMPPERAIAEHRFAYGRDAARRLMEPPPHTLPLEALPPSLALLFERAFADGHGPRPSSEAWISGLGALERAPRQCRVEPAHWYAPHLGKCPWCPIEAAVGYAFFGSPSGPKPDGFDLAAAWAAIAAVGPPGPAPALPSRGQLALRPSAEACVARRRRIGRIALGISVGALGLVAAFGGLKGAGAFWLAVAAIVAGFALGRPDKEERRRFEAARAAAETRWRSAVERWEREASDARFKAKLDELVRAKVAYADLPALRQRRLTQARADLRQTQLRRFLEAHLIERAKIANIGAGRKAILQAYGIENAWDVTERAIAKVPGFGPALTASLLRWRRSVESRFHHDPSRGLDPRDIAAIDQEIAGLARKLATELRAGPEELQRVVQQIATARSMQRVDLEGAFRALVQAEVDLAALA